MHTDRLRALQQQAGGSPRSQPLTPAIVGAPEPAEISRALREQLLRRIDPASGPADVATSATPVAEAAPPRWAELLSRLRPAVGQAAAARPTAPVSKPTPSPLTLAQLGMREVAPGVGLIDIQDSMTGALDDGPALVGFDLETTGLGQATGVRAFLIGIARRNANLLTLRQWLLLKPGSERALLRLALPELEGEALLSFNGRAFDWPLLRERVRLLERRTMLDPTEHVDLLHMIRRRFRHEWPDCRLKTAESRLLQTERTDDLPGSEAPAAWARFIANGAETALCRTIAHNADDLRALHRLHQHLRSNPEPPTRARVAPRSKPPALANEGPPIGDGATLNRDESHAFFAA
jgi:uncharacterized protein